MKIKKVNWICLTLRRNCFVKDIFERKMGREQEEKEISSYWMTLRKQGNTEN
jgi:hypothetical protein